MAIELTARSRLIVVDTIMIAGQQNQSAFRVFYTVESKL
jgi:hypothetical protein